MWLDTQPTEVARQDGHYDLLLKNTVTRSVEFWQMQSACETLTPEIRVCVPPVVWFEKQKHLGLRSGNILDFDKMLINTLCSQSLQTFFCVKQDLDLYLPANNCHYCLKIGNVIKLKFYILVFSITNITIHCICCCFLVVYHDFRDIGWSSWPNPYSWPRLYLHKMLWPFYLYVTQDEGHTHWQVMHHDTNMDRHIQTSTSTCPSAM